MYDLLEDDKYSDFILEEAALSRSPCEMRKLFSKCWCAVKHLMFEKNMKTTFQRILISIFIGNSYIMIQH